MFKIGKKDIKRALKNVKAGPCPREEELASLLEPASDKGKSRLIREHISICEQCSFRFRELENLFKAEPIETDIRFLQFWKPKIKGGSQVILKPKGGIIEILSGWLKPIPLPAARGVSPGFRYQRYEGDIAGQKYEMDIAISSREARIILSAKELAKTPGLVKIIKDTSTIKTLRPKRGKAMFTIKTGGKYQLVMPNNKSIKIEYRSRK